VSITYDAALNPLIFNNKTNNKEYYIFDVLLICGSNGGDYEKCLRVGYDGLHSGRNLQMVRRMCYVSLVACLNYFSL
jgi:hypothetical protein